jgi:hypothetical protein
VKICDVADKLPHKMRQVVAARMRRAYGADSALAAKAELTALAAELDRAHAGGGGQPARGHGRDLRCCAWGYRPPWADAQIDQCRRVHDLNLSSGR